MEYTNISSFFIDSDNFCIKDMEVYHNRSFKKEKTWSDIVIDKVPLLYTWSVEEALNKGNNDSVITIKAKPEKKRESDIPNEEDLNNNLYRIKKNKKNKPKVNKKSNKKECFKDDTIILFKNEKKNNKKKRKVGIGISRDLKEETIIENLGDIDNIDYYSDDDDYGDEDECYYWYNWKVGEYAYSYKINSPKILCTKFTALTTLHFVNSRVFSFKELTYSALSRCYTFV